MSISKDRDYQPGYSFQIPKAVKCLPPGDRGLCTLQGGLSERKPGRLFRESVIRGVGRRGDPGDPRVSSQSKLGQFQTPLLSRNVPVVLQKRCKEIGEKTAMSKNSQRNACYEREM
jgi:hypothetical protein